MAGVACHAHESRAQDPVTPVADHVAMAERIAGARLELIPDCGHLSTLEQPEAVNRLLVEWLDATATAAGH